MNLAQHALKQLKGGSINIESMMDRSKSRHGPAKQKIIDNLDGIKADIRNGATYLDISNKYSVGRSTANIHLPRLLPKELIERLSYNGAYNSSLAVSASNARRNKAKIQAVQ